MRAVSVPLLAAFFVCSLAFSAAPRPNPTAENLQENPKAHEVDSATLDSYQGQYATDANPDSPTSIFHEAGGLYMEGPRSPRRQLVAESKNVFVVKQLQLRLTFVSDASGKVTGVRIGDGNDARLAKRVSDQPVHNNFRPYSRQEFMIP